MHAAQFRYILIGSMCVHLFHCVCANAQRLIKGKRKFSVRATRCHYNAASHAHMYSQSVVCLVEPRLALPICVCICVYR